MSLFDFDFSIDVSQKLLAETANELALLFKKKGNPESYPIGENITLTEFGQMAKTKGLSNKIRPMLHHLNEHGYITFSDDGERVSLKDEYRQYHSLDELVEKFRKNVENYLQKGGHYYGIYNLRTTFTLYYNLKNREEQLKFSRAIENEVSEYGIKLGLRHFLDEPKSRGHKMGLFSNGNLRKVGNHVAKDLLDLHDYKSVKKYFSTHVFLDGVFEYNKQSPLIDHEKIPYLDIRKALPTDFECQCIAEATDVKTIKLIMNYLGNTGPSDDELILISADGTKKQYKKNRDLKKTFNELLDIGESQLDLDIESNELFAAIEGEL